MRGKFVRGNDPTNLYDPDTRSLMSTQLQNVGSHTHSIPSLSGSTVGGSSEGAHIHSLPMDTGTARPITGVSMLHISGNNVGSND